MVLQLGPTYLIRYLFIDDRITVATRCYPETHSLGDMMPYLKHRLFLQLT